MPSENTEQRKLAAIMFTDMVGYSALSQRKEALALELLEEHRRVVRGPHRAAGGGGGICVSEDVERQVRNKLAQLLTALGPAELKNIVLPVVVLWVVLPWETSGAEGKRRNEKGGSEAGRGVPPRRRSALIPAAAALLVLAAGLGWQFVPRRGRDGPGVPRGTRG